MAYHERRFEALRAFEDEGLIRQLRVTDDHLSVRLGDASHLLILGADRLEIGMFDPKGDAQRIELGVRRAWEVFHPTRLSNPRMSFQWLIPVGLSYDEARLAALGPIFGQLGVVKAEDWSATLLGELGDPPATFFAEFGIVEAAEAPRRLARETGYFRGQSRETPPSLWPIDTLPPVAFFLDIGLSSAEALEPDPEEVIKLWQRTQGNAGELVSFLMGQVFKEERE
ncbi:MAG: hypothetical protein LUO93_01065 [Methanomicrobiales archaeon]|nr:hypothetical protein [Methanomicrobiales archaeon]